MLTRTSSGRAPARVTAPIRILLVDDHMLLREGVRAVVSTQTDMEIAGEAGSGAPAGFTVTSIRIPG